MFSARTNWATAPNRLAAALERRRAQGLPILDLTESNPTRCGFDFDQGAILQALADPASIRYEPNPTGLPQARRAVAAYYAEQGISVSPDQLVLTTGTSEAYSFLMRLLADPGDEILSPSPSYPLFDFLADINDATLARYPLVYEQGWRIDLEHLASAVTPRTRAVIVVSPNNPTGSFLRRDEMTALVELAKRHDLAIIADEVFRDYAWQPNTGCAPSLASVRECLTFTLNGLSKICALPQMKLGWIVANGPGDRLRNALTRLEVIADTYLSVSTPIQQAAEVLLEQRRNLQPQILERIRTNLDGLDRTLAAGGPVTRLRAEGGWYAVLQVPGIGDEEDWAVELLERRGVYVHPGHFFDFPEQGHLVLSLITPTESLQAGVQQILGRAAETA